MDKPLLQLTEAAIRHLEQVMTQSDAVGMVIALEKAGCAGYMYRIEPCRQVPEDAQISCFGAHCRIFVPEASVSRIRGSRLDYQKSALEMKAVFDNPNVTLACGCGDSVELRQPEEV